MFSFCLLLCISQNLTAQVSSENPGRFYERKAEGWFWYQEELPEESQDPVEPTDSFISPDLDAIEDMPASVPQVLSSAWFRENLPKYRDAAWDEPTIENARTYMYLQRYAMDRSEQFADAVELAVVGDPFLDEESRRPSATFASQNLDKWAGERSDEIASKIAQKAGLFFFFRSDSDASVVQAPIIKMLEARDGFHVLPISVDGGSLPGDVFPQFRIDEGQAESMGVEVFPALYLVSAEREVEPIAQGVLSLADLKHRIILAAKRRGWISDEEFNKTKPLLNLDNNVAAILDSYSHELSELPKDNANSDSTFIPPAMLSDFIRNRLRGER